MRRNSRADLNISLLKLYSNESFKLLLMYISLFIGVASGTVIFINIEISEWLSIIMLLFVSCSTTLGMMFACHAIRDTLPFLKSPDKNFLRYFIDQQFLPKELFMSKYISIGNNITNKTRYYAPRFFAQYIEPDYYFRQALKIYDKMGAFVSTLHYKYKLPLELVVTLYELLGINIFKEHFLGDIDPSKQPNYQTEHVEKLIFSVKEDDIEDGELVQKTIEIVKDESMKHIVRMSSFMRFCEKYPILETSNRAAVSPEISETQRQLRILDMV